MKCVKARPPIIVNAAYVIDKSTHFKSFLPESNLTGQGLIAINFTLVMQHHITLVDHAKQI